MEERCHLAAQKAIPCSLCPPAVPTATSTGLTLPPSSKEPEFGRPGSDLEFSSSSTLEANYKRDLVPILLSGSLLHVWLDPGTPGARSRHPLLLPIHYCQEPWRNYPPSAEKQAMEVSCGPSRVLVNKSPVKSPSRPFRHLRSTKAGSFKAQYLRYHFV